jgi:hypothetical protein
MYCTGGGCLEGGAGRGEVVWGNPGSVELGERCWGGAGLGTRGLGGGG